MDSAVPSRPPPDRRRPMVRVTVNFASEFGRAIMIGVLAEARARRDCDVGKAIEVPEPASAGGSPPDIYIVQIPNAGMEARVRKLEGTLVVNVSGMREVPWPTVRIDDAVVGTLAAEHLLARGIRAFGYGGYPQQDFAKRRGEAFRERLRREPGVRLAPTIWEPGRKVRDWLPPAHGTIGVLCCSDHLATGFLRACAAEGVRVPEDVAVLGVDNDALESEFATPPLSSIDVAGERIGAEALRLALERFAGRDTPNLVEIPPRRIVTRQSTEILAVADPLVARVLRAIHDRAHEPLPVDELVRLVPLNRRMLEIRFRRAVGRTIHAEIVRVRLERACDLLAAGDLTVERIAALTGFGESRQMSAAFRRHIGMTPSGWRRRHRGF